MIYLLFDFKIVADKFQKEKVLFTGDFIFTLTISDWIKYHSLKMFRMNIERDNSGKCSKALAFGL